MKIMKSRSVLGGVAVAATLLGSAALVGCSSVAGDAKTSASASASQSADKAASPEDRVFDALRKISSKPITGAEGNIKGDIDGGTMDVTVGVKSSAEFAQASLDMSMKTKEVTLNNFKVEAISDAKGDTMYLKIADPKSVLEQIAAQSKSSSMNLSVFDPAIAKIDGKFIKVDAKEFGDVASTAAGDADAQKCIADLQAAMKDEAAVTEVVDVIKKSGAFTAKESKSAEINGEDSQGYEITVDEAKAKAVGPSLKTTKLGKLIEGCNTDSSKDSKSDSTSDSSSDDTTMTVYVGKDTQQLNRLSLEGKTEEGNMTADISLGYDEVDVKAPAAAETVTLKEAVDAVQPGFYDMMMENAKASAAK